MGCASSHRCWTGGKRSLHHATKFLINSQMGDGDFPQELMGSLARIVDHLCCTQKHFPYMGSRRIQMSSSFLQSVVSFVVSFAWSVNGTLWYVPWMILWWSGVVR